MAPQDSQMCGGNFPKRKQSNADFVPNTIHVVTIEIAINSIRGAQHFALYPAGIAFGTRACALSMPNCFKYLHCIGFPALISACATVQNECVSYRHHNKLITALV